MTITEFHNSHFNIERKYSDEFNFMAIGRKNSAHAEGNSQSPAKYNWKDYANNNKGPIQYRIQQQGLDGNYAYSNIIIIKPEPSLLFIENIYPNLSVKDQLYIKTGNRNIKKMQVSIYDMKGSMLFRKQMNYQSQWLPLPQLGRGTYKMFIRSEEYYWTGSFVKE